jgi:hypothetical protein
VPAKLPPRPPAPTLRTAEITIVFERTVPGDEVLDSDPLFAHLAHLSSEWRWWQQQGTIRVGRRIEYQLSFKRPRAR